MNEKSFCDVFKDLRMEKNMSQDAIAKELDVSQSLINNWETGRSTPAPEMLEYIADYFDISVDYLIGRTTDRRWYESSIDNTLRNKLYEDLGTLSSSSLKFVAKICSDTISAFKNFDDNYIFTNIEDKSIQDK